MILNQNLFEVEQINGVRNNCWKQRGGEVLAVGGERAQFVLYFFIQGRHGQADQQ